MPAGVSAWTPLANIAIGSSPTTVTFSSINQSHRDLVLVGSVIPNASTTVYLRFNSDSGTSYNYTTMGGNGSSAFADNVQTSVALNLNAGGATGATSGNYMSIVASIMDYSQTDKQKCVLARLGSPGVGTGALSSRWNNTSAITSITVGAFNFAPGTTLALYGVSA